MQQLMRKWMIPSLSVVLGLCLSLQAHDPVMADETTTLRLSQTVEGQGLETVEDLTQLLDQAPIQAASELVIFGDRESETIATKLLTAEHLVDQIFLIFDAQTVLNIDDDADGFFQHLKVTFDADVDYGDAHVYAMLYLSLEGGPWNHYFTTDVFHIEEDFSDDEYVVETRLLEGYPTGYYDVLIELYEADLDIHVASYGPNDTDMLFALPLEDQQRDYPSTDYYVYDDCHDCGGGGSFGWFSLLSLLLLRRSQKLREWGSRVVTSHKQRLTQP